MLYVVGLFGKAFQRRCALPGKCLLSWEVGLVG
jgi:hypothetical protein